MHIWKLIWTHAQTSLSLSLFRYTSCHSGKVVGNIYI